MYRHGRPVHKHNFKMLLIILFIVLAVVAGIYFIFVKNNNSKMVVTSKSTKTTTTVEASPSITIDEPLFTLELPGQWRETARDTQPGYHSIQWNFVAKNAASRWVRIYIDTIPAAFAINYIQPITANNNGLNLGQMSDNCVTFTQGATPSTSRDVSVPQSQAALPARWQGVSFMCDNSHVSHQVVGTGSIEGGNAVTVSGPQHGSHKYFLVYQDNNYHPDFSIFMNVLESFKAK